MTYLQQGITYSADYWDGYTTEIIRAGGQIVASRTMS